MSHAYYAVVLDGLLTAYRWDTLILGRRSHASASNQRRT